MEAAVATTVEKPHKAQIRPRGIIYDTKIQSVCEPIIQGSTVGATFAVFCPLKAAGSCREVASFGSCSKLSSCLLAVKTNVILSMLL